MNAPDNAPLSETDKVAVLLIALGTERATRILDQLGPDEMLPIIAAMRRVGRISPELRNAVLWEVRDILEDLAAGRPPRDSSRPGDDSPGGVPPAVNLFARLGPYLPETIDPDRLDGSDLDGGGDEEDPNPPSPPRGRP